VAALALAASTAGATTGWQILKSRSVTGQFAVTAISATVKYPKPKGIAVRLIGRVSSGSAVIACSKGFSVASWTRSYTQAGLYVLPMTRAATSCLVTASIGGSGKVTVRILKL
jgi:hypothetical protein